MSRVLVETEMRAKDYYAQLKEGYSTKIRQLVPKYDDMTRCIADLVKLRAPATVLDIGAGVGNLSRIILQEMPIVQITAVEASGEMISEAEKVLQPDLNRVTLVCKDILEFSPEATFDSIFSNLVLHNIPHDRKKKLASAINDWLNPGGSFIWGDLIRHSDSQIQNHFIRQRKAHAISTGCPDELIRRNFEKEAEQDYPLTTEETLEVARRAEFADAELAWAHDTFAVFFLGKGNRSNNSGADYG